MSRVESPQQRGILAAAAAQSRSSAGAFWTRWRAPRRDEDARLDPLLVLRLSGVALVVAVLAAWLGDRTIALAARQLPGGVVAIANFVSAIGSAGYILVLSGVIALAAAALWRSGGGKVFDAAVATLGQRAFYVFCCVMASGLATQVLKHVLARGRPKLMDELGPFHLDFFAVDASFASFPSGHTTTAFAAAAALALIAPRWRWPLFLVAACVGLARVALGAHYPSDVVAGAFVGVLSSYMVAAAFLGRRMVFAVRDGAAALRGRGLVLPMLRSLAARRAGARA